MKGKSMGNDNQVTHSWLKDGVKVCTNDEVVLAQDDDCHPDNTLKNTEFHVVRDGEIIARLWWLR